MTFLLSCVKVYFCTFLHKRIYLRKQDKKLYEELKKQMKRKREMNFNKNIINISQNKALSLKKPLLWKFLMIKNINDKALQNLNIQKRKVR